MRSALSVRYTRYTSTHGHSISAPNTRFIPDENYFCCLQKSLWIMFDILFNVMVSELCFICNFWSIFLFVWSIKSSIVKKYRIFSYLMVQSFLNCNLRQSDVPQVYPPCWCGSDLKVLTVFILWPSGCRWFSKLRNGLQFFFPFNIILVLSKGLVF